MAAANYQYSIIQEGEILGGCAIIHEDENLNELNNLLKRMKLRDKPYSLKFTECNFTEDAKKAAGTLFIRTLATHFNLTDIEHNAEMFDERSVPKIQDLLKRNRNLNSFNQKLNIVIGASLIVLMANAFILPVVSIAFAALLNGYYFHRARRSEEHDQQLKLFFTLTFISIVSFFNLGLVSVGAFLALGLTGLGINYGRNEYIKKAIVNHQNEITRLSTLSEDDVGLALEQAFDNSYNQSYLQGSQSQKESVPALLWSKATWMRPEGYYVGRFMPESCYEDMATLPSKRHP